MRQWRRRGGCVRRGLLVVDGTVEAPCGAPALLVERILRLSGGTVSHGNYSYNAKGTDKLAARKKGSAEGVRRGGDQAAP